MISFIWIIAAIGNNVLIHLRGTPLTGSDLKLIKSGLTLINNYMSKKEIVAILTVLFFIFANALARIKEINTDENGTTTA